MRTRLFAGIVGACLLLAPLCAADKDQTARNSRNQAQDSDMQRAIAFEHYKDLAAARQARKEAQHPTVFYNNADRSSDREDNNQGRRVKPADPLGK